MIVNRKTYGPGKEKCSSQKKYSRANKSIAIALLFFLFIGKGLAQQAPGKITGKITDGATNITLSGVSISVQGSKLGGTSITDGSYIITLPAGTYTITYSYTGYASKSLGGIVIKSGETTFQDIILETDTKQLGGVVITATSAKKESQSAVYSAQKRSSAVSDGISQESIRKTPDNNTAQVLKRVTGVNVQDNRFVVVRGLGDQYNQTMLNGAAMTSTETNRNAFAFDLIPAAVVENVTINKTATPDMPGNFAGGIVQINTKDFPDNDFFSITLQAGFSDGTLGKDFYSDKRNNVEWLGLGGKIRDLPKGFPLSTSRVPFTDLNLQEQTRYLRMLKNNLAPINYGPSAPNTNVQFGYGKTLKFKNATQFGIVAALNHRKTEIIEQESVSRDPSLTIASSSDPGKLEGLGNYSENTRYRYSVDLGGVLNLAYRFGNNKVTLKNLFTQVFKNVYTERPYIITDIDAFIPVPPYDMTVGLSYFTEQRRIINSILGGEHRTGKNNETKIDWNINVTTINTKTPDSRNFILLTDSLRKNGYQVSNNANLQYSLIGNSRVWYDNKDLITGGAFNLTTPFMLLRNKQLLKGGLLFQNRSRKATGTVLPISGLHSNTIDSLLRPENFYPGGGQVNVASASLSGGSGNYDAGSSLLAAYESLENKIGEKIRVIWGLRIENYQQTVNVYDPAFFDNFQDPDLLTVKFAASTTFNFLPSVNLVYSPFKSINVRGAYSNTVIRPELKDLAPFERFDLQSFSLTSGNSDLKSTSIQNYDVKIEWFPSSGEIMSIAGFYKVLQDPIEYAFSDLSNNVSSRFAINSGTAYVKGIEAEIRKKLDFISFAPWLKNVTLFGNGSLIHSRVSGKKINSTVLSSFSEHPLTGQPDYIINAGISILAFKETFETTASFNRTADFINELGSSDLDVPVPNGLIPIRPHYREKARNLVDLVVSKSLLHNKARIKFNISNLLKERYIIYEDLNGNGKFDVPVRIKNQAGRNNNYLSGIDNAVSSITPQRSYSLSISYTF
jgi:hypothetical protein